MLFRSRMAWQFGGVAESLGVSTKLPTERLELDDAKALDINPELDLEPNQIDYDRLIRFPNLSSIASARFLHDEIGRASCRERV